jgi:CIC family chloride channel protein
MTFSFVECASNWDDLQFPRMPMNFSWNRLTGWDWARRQWAEGLGPSNTVILLAAATGMVSGMIAVLLKNGVGWLRDLPWIAQGSKGWEIRFILPIVGLVLTHVLIRKVFSDKHPGPGIPATLHAISRLRARLSRMSMISPVSASFITVGFGGSAGLEAPTVQSSAAVASEAAARFNLDYRHRLVLIGCAATASLFNAPLAAIVFAVEVIMIHFTTASLVPLLVSSLSALLTTALFIDPDELIKAGRNLPDWDGTFLAYIPFAILCGMASVWFSAIYRGTGGAIRRFRHRGARIIVAGTLIGAALVAFPSLYGEGFDLINDLLRGQGIGRLDPLDRGAIIPSVSSKGNFSGTSLRLLFILCVLWICKPALTGLTVGAGGVGGIFAPALFSGAMLGGIYLTVTDLVFPSWHLIGGHFLLAGMAGLLSGILRAPLTAIFLAAEASGGYDLFIPLMLTSAIAFQTARWMRPNSIYTEELAERGELITHDKDKAVLTLMRLADEVERDFDPVRPDMSLGELVEVVARSKRNIHPVVGDDGKLVGIMPLEEIRAIMFDRDRYDALFIRDLMVMPAATLEWGEHMDAVMEKFDRTQAWNLPVLENGKYVGFVSRSKLFGAYRNWLQAVSED